MKIFMFQGQLDGFLDTLQERSLKIEGFVSEIEALFNSLEVGLLPGFLLCNTFSTLQDFGHFQHGSTD